MGWELYNDATQETSIDGTARPFDEFPSADPGEAINIQVKTLSSGSTDDSLVKIYGAVGPNTQFGDLPIAQFTIDNSANDNLWHPISVSGHPFYKVTIERVSGTETFTGDMRWQADGVSL